MNIINKILIKTIKLLLWIVDSEHRENHNIDLKNNKKFTDTFICDFQSDFGRCTSVFRTVPYDVWELKTETKTLICADKHIVIDADDIERWIIDLEPGDVLKTKTGNERVISVKNLGIKLHMYDVQLNTSDHLYYSNDILSHNTTCAAAYLLWLATFFSDKTILICANQLNQAIEIMDRIKFSYENMEDNDWIRPGIVEYNKGTITFDNGSSIVCRATTPHAGRGLSISCLYCLHGSTNVTVRNKVTGVVETISLEDLHNRLNS